MILGPFETYELLLHMGKLPKAMDPDIRRRVLSEGLLLPFPQQMREQEIVLDEPPRLHQKTKETLQSLGLCQQRYTTLVSDQVLRRNSSSLNCLVLGYKFPVDSILRVIDDVFILSPSACLLLLARMPQLCDEELAFAASQLCSRYAYAMGTGELIERVPHTSVNRICSYLEEFEELNAQRRPRGMRRLQRLLPYVPEATRSPREVATGLIMRWPDKRECLNVPEFEMNKSICLSAQEQRELGKGSLEPDFKWEKEKVIIEYNGGVHADQREEDSLRVNVLRDKGYRVEILTAGILDNCEAYLKFMRRLEDSLDFRVPRCANEINSFAAFHGRVIKIANRQGRFVSPGGQAYGDYRG